MDPSVERDANALMVAYHTALVDATPRAFEPWRGRDGRNGYDLLVDGARPLLAGAVVLDLGCGGGVLLERLAGAAERIGVDLTPAQLRRARARLGPDVALHHADVTALPLADACVDLAVSHMAFQLFRPLDRAMDELRRVLRPGGAVRFVVDGPRVPSAGTTALQREIWPVMDAAVDRLASMHIGDRRTGQPELLQRLFARGFTDVALVEHPTFLRGPVEQHVAHLTGMYNLWEMGRRERKRLVDRLRTALTEVADPDGTLELGMTARLISATRAAG